MANEVRLIDANAFYERLEDIRMEYLEEDTMSSNFAAEVIETVLDSYLKDAPTIDPESLRPKGRWELHGNDDDCGCSYFCSNCYRSYPEEWFYDHGQYVPFENCPHCTAKMEG